MLQRTKGEGKQYSDTWVKIMSGYAEEYQWLWSSKEYLLSFLLPVGLISLQLRVLELWFRWVECWACWKVEFVGFRVSWFGVLVVTVFGFRGLGFS